MASIDWTGGRGNGGCFLAKNLVRETQGGGVPGEDITVHHVPLTELHAWLRDQEAAGTAIDYKIHSSLWPATLETRVIRPDTLDYQVSKPL